MVLLLVQELPPYSVIPLTEREQQLGGLGRSDVVLPPSLCLLVGARVEHFAECEERIPAVSSVQVVGGGVRVPPTLS